jgi:hypothetical protein
LKLSWHHERRENQRCLFVLPYSITPFFLHYTETHDFILQVCRFPLPLVIRGEALDPAVQHAPQELNTSARSSCNHSGTGRSMEIPSLAHHHFSGFSDWVSVSVSHTLARVKTIQIFFAANAPSPAEDASQTCQIMPIPVSDGAGWLAVVGSAGHLRVVGAA